MLIFWFSKFLLQMWGTFALSLSFEWVEKVVQKNPWYNKELGELLADKT